jgi:hypothetical protein
MKVRAIIFISLISSITMYAGIDCNSFLSSNGKHSIYLKEKYFKLRLLPLTHDTLQSDNIFIGDVVLFSKDVQFKDDLIIVKIQNKAFIFKRFNSDIIIAQSNILKHIKRGEKFYCSRYNQPDGAFLSGNSWKNNKKNGEWTYVNPKKGEIYIYTYKNGKIIRKKKTSKDQTVKIPYLFPVSP